jgi:hypothetical protein
MRWTNRCQSRSQRKKRALSLRRPHRNNGEAGQRAEVGTVEAGAIDAITAHKWD